MVAAVVDGSADDNHSEPKPRHGKVRPGHYWTSYHRTKVDDKVLKGVAVDGSHTHRSCPLVMCLMNVLVELWMMKESASEYTCVEKFYTYSSNAAEPFYSGQPCSKL